MPEDPQPSVNQTHASLVDRLHTLSDRAAWDEFYDHYWRLVVNFALRQGCSQDMSWDVLQETMMVLMYEMPRFSYDPSKGKFRSFLLRIVSHQIANAYRRERKFVPLPDESADRIIQDSKHPPDASDIQAVWDREWENNLLGLAMLRVEKRVRPQTLESFRLHVFEGWPADRVAEHLGIERNGVHQHRNRIIEMIRQEVNDLNEESLR